MGFKRPNYTKYPNEVLDRINELSGAELKLISVICRQTMGWGRDHSKMSLSFLRSATGLSKQGLLNTIDSLIKRDWIERFPEGDSYVYGMKFEESEVVNSVDHPSQKVVNSVDQGSQLSRPPLVNSVDPQVVNSVDPNKERSLKETFKDSEKESEHTHKESVEPESEPVTNNPPFNPPSQNGNTDKLKGIAEDEYSAAPPKFEIESKQWLCHKAPWHESISTYKDEMLEAVFQGDRTYYGLEGGRRNKRRIEAHLQKLERQSIEYGDRPDSHYDLTTIQSRQALLSYWELAQAIAAARQKVPAPSAVSSPAEISPPTPEFLETIRKLRGKRNAS